MFTTALAKAIDPQPRVRISIYRSEVKDLCCAVIAPVMEKIGDPIEIANTVRSQLFNYTYTCPNAPNVRIYLTLSSV